MCGFLANTRDWDIISIPPTMTAGKRKKGECQKQHQTKTLELSAIKTYNGHIPHLTPILEPSASNCSEI